VQGRLAMANDEQYTPKYIFSLMDLEFDLDVAAPIDGISWIPAKHHYSKFDDALTKKWFGLVWMNPPYSKPGPWVDKFIEHANGVALLPMSKSAWSMKLWNKADAISYVGTMKFVQSDGEFSQIFMPVLLYAMGEKAVEGVNNASQSRVR
jgi:hypothetical protein